MTKLFKKINTNKLAAWILAFAVALFIGGIYRIELQSAQAAQKLSVPQGGTNNDAFPLHSFLATGTSTNPQILTGTTSPTFGFVNASSTSATSTFASGLNITGRGLRVVGGTRLDSLEVTGTGTTTFTGGGGIQFTGNGNVCLANGTCLSAASLTGSGSANQVTYWSGATALTGNANFIFDGTNLGVGTSTPGTLLSVGSVANFNTGTSTIFQGLKVGGLHATSSGITITGGNIHLTSGATSTFNNGIVLTDGCIFKTAINACITDVPNNLTGILEEVGGTIGVVTIGSSLDYTGTTLSVGTVSIGDGGTNATTQTTNGVNYYNGTSITSGTGLTFTGTNLGIATTTPGALLSVGAGGNWGSTGLFSYSPLFFPSFTATSTTATSTIAGGLDITAGGLRVVGGTRISNPFTLSSLNCTGNTNGGALTTTSGGEVVCSDDDSGGGGGTAQGADGNIQFATSGSFNSSGGLTFTLSNGRLGIGTSTPSYMLSIGATTTPAIGLFASSTAVVKENNHASDSATMNINWNVSNQHRLTLTGNQTITFTGGEYGGTYRIVLCQDGTGTRRPTWPTTVLFPNGSTTPTLSSRAGACDIISFIGSLGTTTSIRFFGSETNYAGDVQ